MANTSSSGGGGNAGKVNLVKFKSIYINLDVWTSGLLSVIYLSLSKGFLIKKSSF